MKIEQLKLTNWGGIRELTIPCGSVTIVRGSNGTGKTSIISAFDSIFNGGHNSDAIGRFGEKAVAEILLDNGVTIKRTVTRKTSEYKVTTADGSIVPSPATYVQKLVTGLSLNPTGLVDAPQKDRVKFLQSVMPLEFTREEIAPLCEGHDGPVPTRMDVQQFNNFRQGRYESRAELNRKKKTLDGAVQMLRRALPDEPEATDWRSARSGLQQQLDEKREEIRQAGAAVVKEESIAKDRVRSVLDGKLDEIRRRMEAEMNAARAETNDEFAAIDAHTRERLNEVEAPIRSEIERLTGEIASLEEKVNQQLKAEGTKADLEKLEGDMKSVIRQVAQLDRTIEALDDLKKQKLDAMPIPGVEIRDGQIFYNGLNFDTQLNTAQKYILSFQVASLTLGDLPFMVFDGAEALDAENKSMFIEGMREAGLQVVLAEVASGEPLTVEQVA